MKVIGPTRPASMTNTSSTCPAVGSDVGDAGRQVRPSRTPTPLRTASRVNENGEIAVSGDRGAEHEHRPRAARPSSPDGHGVTGSRRRNTLTSLSTADLGPHREPEHGERGDLDTAAGRGGPAPMNISAVMKLSVGSRMCTDVDRVEPGGPRCDALEPGGLQLVPDAQAGRASRGSSTRRPGRTAGRRRAAPRWRRA